MKLRTFIPKIVSLGFSLVAALNAFAQSYTIQGKVFIDKNQNLTLDKSEKGIAGVLISNGVDIVKTDKSGNYRIMVKNGQSLFPILPSAYKILDKEASLVQNAKFHYFPKEFQDAQKQIDFPISAVQVKENFTIGAIGDVQIDNDEEMSYAAKSIFSEMTNTKDIDFHILLGDLVNNRMDLLPEVKKQLNSLNVDTWVLPGNHDRDVSGQDALNNVFNRQFGADTYSFNYGKVHFIVLNNVFPTDKKSYEGRINPEQLQFIKNDLQYVSKNTTVVISQHIPMVGTKNREELFQLLEGYHKVLILSGHTHVVSRHIFKEGRIHEIGAGATCGTWWRGEKDMYGVPLALMQCGSPRGYFVINFNKGNYEFNYKIVGADKQKQIGFHYENNELIANVYAGSDSSKVSFQINGSEWKPMQKARRVDPLVEQIVAKNKNKIYPTTGNKALPLRERKSSHIWTAAYPKPDSDKAVAIRVRVEDNLGYHTEETFILYQ